MVTTIWSLIRVGSSSFFRSSKTITRRSLSLSVTKRDWIRCMRPGSRGMGRSSPSEMFPERAITLKATRPTRMGVLMGKDRLVPPPAFTVNGCWVAFFLERPNSERRLFSVSGSMMSKSTWPLSSSSEALLTTTLMVAWSPSRRKRGR